MILRNPSDLEVAQTMYYVPDYNTTKDNVEKSDDWRELWTSPIMMPIPYGSPSCPYARAAFVLARP